jgi:hypothetical protein
LSRPILAACLASRNRWPPLPPRWTIYKLAARQIWLGEAGEAVEKAAAQFRQVREEADGGAVRLRPHPADLSITP